jgi:hypothetical protein
MSRALAVSISKAKKLRRPSVYYWNVKVLPIDSDSSLNLLLRISAHQYLVCFVSREHLSLGFVLGKKNQWTL